MVRFTFGLLPASAQAKVPFVGTVATEFGPKAAVFGEFTVATDGLWYDYGVEGGASAAVTAGPVSAGGSCKANPGSGAVSCSAQASMRGSSGGQTSSISANGDVGAGFGGGAAKVGVVVKLQNLIRPVAESLVQQLREAYDAWKETWRVIQEVSSPASQ